MTQNTLITGANRGIGLELTRLLRSRGDHVIAAVRNATPELESLGAEVVTGVDLRRDDALNQLRAALADRPLKLLIANAGILRSNSLEALNPDDIREQFEVNALAPLRLVHAVLPQLVPGAVVALITSRMGSMADNTSGGSYGYRMSKAALNAAGKSLAVDLAKRSIAVGLLHPGWVKTDMTGHSGNTTPDQAAAQLLERIDHLDLETTGSFLHANGDLLPF